MSVSFLIEENEGIAKFLNGDDSCIPIGEYKYLHDRPLLRPTFLSQIDDLAHRVAAKITKNNLKSGIPADTLTKHAITIGVNLEGNLDDTKAANILIALRHIYTICLELDKKLK
jgi:hypothetical protein